MPSRDNGKEKNGLKKEMSLIENLSYLNSLWGSRLLEKPSYLRSVEN